MKCSVKNCKYVNAKRFHKGMCFNHYEKQYEIEHPEYRAKKRITSKAWARANPGKQKEYRSTPEARFKMLIRGTQRRGIELSISLEQWKALITGAACEYCEGKLPEQGTGLDRKDSSLGYVENNLVPCCTACNSIKGEDNISFEEMKYLIPLLLEFRNNGRATFAIAGVNV